MLSSHLEGVGPYVFTTPPNAWGNCNEIYIKGMLSSHFVGDVALGMNSLVFRALLKHLEES
jgi:hypothetical protein